TGRQANHVHRNLLQPHDGTQARTGDHPQDELGNTVTLTLAEHPLEPGRGYLGVNVENDVTAYMSSGELPWKIRVAIWLYGLFMWILFLSLALGLGNLLPLGPFDGGRMFLLFLQGRFTEERAKAIWTKVSVLLLIILLCLVFIPMIRAILSDHILPLLG
ncbi:MAG: hypothetical protein HC945_03040, partial [Nitrosarchaeum sp.]|nr:hypothetical protein [Nitrosarchaeum sp.]